jgi:hypothetical protein
MNAIVSFSVELLRYSEDLSDQHEYQEIERRTRQWQQLFV